MKVINLGVLQSSEKRRFFFFRYSIIASLYSPSPMMAEKIADSILDNEPLEPIDAKFYVHPDWENKQR